MSRRAQFAALLLIVTAATLGHDAALAQSPSPSVPPLEDVDVQANILALVLLSVAGLGGFAVARWLRARRRR